MSSNTNTSQDEITSKEEKLRRRREQLLAWKQKKEEEQKAEKKQDGVVPEVGETSIVQDEKIKRRQELLAKWKAKKEQEKKESEKKESEKADAQSSDAEKVRLRQERLAQWKKKKENKVIPRSTSQEPLRPLKVVSGFSIRKNLSESTTKGKKPTILKRSLLADDNADEVVVKKLRLPGSKPSTEKPPVSILQDEEVDELDLFLESLASNSTTKNDGLHVSLIEKDDEEEAFEEDEADDDEAQQKLLFQRLEKLNKQKELALVNFDEANLAPFRKNFYVESGEIKAISDEDVLMFRMLDGVKVRGVDVPKPISEWKHLGLMTSVQENLESRFARPTPIQCQALPIIASGRDLIGVAKTGSGKTLSFVLPILRHIQDQLSQNRERGPIGLIMTPTRELALQIHKELTMFTKPLGILVICCYGGSSIELQIADLKRGCDIIVGTPGRIIDLLAANNGRVTNLHLVTYVVLDEADRMFDMGFEPQVTKIFTQVRPDRQCVLFSATFPRKMEVLAKRILHRPIEIIVGGVSVVALDVTQKVELFEEKNDDQLRELKLTRLLDLLQDNKNGKILIFVETQAGVDDLLVQLLKRSIPCLAIHGGKDQVDRKHTIKDFSLPDSGLDILIATSIAARGLDVKGLKLVINFDAPNHMEDYVHRVGRTGRAGTKGVAVTFVNYTEERAITDLVKSMRMSKMEDSEIPAKLLAISAEFLDKVKAGKEKYTFGFGGKGLENLEEQRQNTRDLERKVFVKNQDEDNSEAKEKSTSGRASIKVSAATESLLPDFQVIEGQTPETSGPDKCKFYSRVVINDLPQKARWLVVNRDSISKIIESTSTSITNKGQYYPPNAKIPTASANSKPVPPKLYLLVEGLTEASVRAANNLIRLRMIEGLEVAAKDDLKGGPATKYTV